MTRAQFLNNLYRRLGGLTKEQAEQHLTYYAEMLADRMEEGMTEEEAVASMEDVETIAQRILQDEAASGAAAQPPNETGTVPPAPKKKDWRKPAKVLLWALALLVAGGMLFNRFASRDGNVAPDIPNAPEIPDVPEVPEIPDGLDIGGIHVGPDGIYISDGEHAVSVTPDGVEIAGDWDDWDVGTHFDVDGAGGYDHQGEDYQADASGIREIEIDWLAGLVDIQAGDGETISFHENATRELTEETKLVWKLDGDKLQVDFCKNRRGISNTTYPAKRLTMYVPQDMMDELEVSTTSGDVLIAELSVRSLKVDTTSGSTVLSGVSVDSFEADTTSGGVGGSVEAREVEVDTISGDVNLFVDGASEIEMDAVSGDLILSLRGTTGFTLEFETVSGDLDMEDFQTTRRNNKYVCGSGDCKIKVDTISGDLNLQAD